MSQAAITSTLTYKDFSRHWVLACLFGYYGLVVFCVAVATHATLVPAVGAIGGGLILATLQWLVLHRYGAGVSWAQWTLATILGYLIGLNALAFVWLVILPALEPAVINRVGNSLFLAVWLTGCAALGLLQWSILRRYVRHAWHWVYLQVGVGAIDLFILSWIPLGIPTSLQEQILLFGMVFGLTGGTLMGIVLVRLLSSYVVPIQTRMYLTPGSFVLLLGTMMILTITTLWLPTMHFPHKENLPIYPGARQVHTTSDRQVRIFGLEQQTAFETLASPQEIGSFYKSTFIQDGWELAVAGAQPTDRPGITLWSFHAKDWGCLVYRLDLEITPLADGVTDVKLLVSTRGCY
jgi:hypothetical protein